MSEATEIEKQIRERLEQELYQRHDALARQAYRILQPDEDWRAANIWAVLCEYRDKVVKAGVANQFPKAIRNLLSKVSIGVLLDEPTEKTSP